MRKLDTRRLYKFARILVIIITAISIILVIFLNYERVVDSGSYYKSYWSTVFNVAKSCKDLYPTSEADRGSCFDDAMEGWSNIDNISSASLKIAIFLPLLFFGGTWLYKYLFPLKRK